MLQKNEVLAPERHSHVVGGSSAARVLGCPASVKLCQQMPPSPPNKYTREGSMLHGAIAAVVEDTLYPEDMIGFELDGVVLDEELLEEKLAPAVQMFDTLLDELEAEFGEKTKVVVEKEVHFGRFIPDAFGSCDVIIRCGSRVVVLDWKFGSGVQVAAEENAQLMFYAAAAARTPELKPMFEGAEEVNLVIIQPPSISVWQTTFPRLTRFEKELKTAVKKSAMTNPPMKEGAHCKWCSAKAVCPLMNGAVDRAVTTNLKELDVQTLGNAYRQSILLESWIKELHVLLHTAMEEGIDIPGLKLVDKRATRKWAVEDDQVVCRLKALVEEDKMFESKLKSPTQMEKVLKAKGEKLPDEIVKKESSGTTIALAEDKRAPVNKRANLKAKLGQLRP